MLKGVIVNNGVDVDPVYTNTILFADHYQGNKTLNPTATPGSGGSLMINETYYYQVVAIANRNITIEGDTLSPQLSALDLIGVSNSTVFWQMTKSGTIITFNVSTDPDGQFLIASGSRTNDGAITLTQKNDSNVNGTVTVTYTSDEHDAANKLIIERNIEVGFDEVNASTDTTNKTIALAFDAVTNAVEYRIYRGTTTDIYDGYFVATTNSFSDDGTSKLCFDRSITKDEILGLSKTFTGEQVVNDVIQPMESKVHLHLKYNKHEMIDCTKVTNKPTWDDGTEAATQKALIEIQGWLL